MPYILKQRPQIVLWPFRDYLDVVIPKISNITCQAKFVSLPLDRSPEAHPLHSTSHSGL